MTRPGDQDSPGGPWPRRRASRRLAGILLFLGPALGPTVGGALIGAAGWRGIFLINVPLGALAAVAVRLRPGRAGAGTPARAPGSTCPG